MTSASNCGRVIRLNARFTCTRSRIRSSRLPNRCSLLRSTARTMASSACVHPHKSCVLHPVPSPDTNAHMFALDSISQMLVLSRRTTTGRKSTTSTTQTKRVTTGKSLVRSVLTTYLDPLNFSSSLTFPVLSHVAPQEEAAPWVVSLDGHVPDPASFGPRVNPVARDSGFIKYVEPSSTSTSGMASFTFKTSQVSASR